MERFLHIPGTKVVALCDIRPEQVEKCQGILKKAGVLEAVGYSGSEDAWKQLCERDDINLVYIATDWLHHAPMALYAMEHGKHVAIEVPAAMNMEEIWALINMAEKKQLHCMMLENCVYDFFELTTLNMAQQGVFGEVLHVEGAYIHNLEEFWPYYWNNWRMDYNRKHRGDIYATHGMGPACQLLGGQDELLGMYGYEGRFGSRVFEKQDWGRGERFQEWGSHDHADSHGKREDYPDSA